jgi:hypothetical protein
MMTEPVKCTACGQDTHPLELFPGNKCLECYDKEEEGKPLPTAQEIAQMFRRAVNVK